MRFWTWIFRTFARKRLSETQERIGRSYHLADDRKSRNKAAAREFAPEVRSVQQLVSVILGFRLCKPRRELALERSFARLLTRRNPMPPESVKAGSGLGRRT